MFSICFIFVFVFCLSCAYYVHILLEPILIFHQLYPNDLQGNLNQNTMVIVVYNLLISNMPIFILIIPFLNIESGTWWSLRKWQVPILTSITPNVANFPLHRNIRVGIIPFPERHHFYNTCNKNLCLQTYCALKIIHWPIWTGGRHLMTWLHVFTYQHLKCRSCIYKKPELSHHCVCRWPSTWWC